MKLKNTLGGSLNNRLRASANKYREFIINSKAITDSKPPAWLLFSVLFLSNISEAIYTPSLVSIAQIFTVSKTSMQFTVTVFILAFAISQPAYGFLSDSYGRKPILILGQSLFLVGTLVCSVSDSWVWLVCGRVLQGAGASSGSVLVRAMVRDAFEPLEQRKVFAYILSGVTLAPLIGASIGGFLTTFVGWRFIFITLLLLIMLIFLMVIICLPETITTNKMKVFQPRKFFHDAAHVYHKSTFFIHALIGGLLLSIPFIYLIEAPFIFIKQLGLLSYQYGLVFLFTSLGAVSGSYLSAHLSQRINRHTAITLGIFIAGCAATVMLLLNIYLQTSILTILLPMVALMLGVLLAKSNVSTTALLPFTNRAGLASALLGFTQMGIAGLLTYVFQVLPNKSPFPMLWAFIVILLLALFLSLFGWKQAKAP